MSALGYACEITSSKQTRISSYCERQTYLRTSYCESIANAVRGTSQWYFCLTKDGCRRDLGDITLARKKNEEDTCATRRVL